MKPFEVCEGERTRRRVVPLVLLNACPHVTCVHAWLDAKETALHSADAFCFSQLNCSSRHKNCLLSLSKPNAFSCPFSCPPACLVSSPVSFSCYSGNPYIFISYLNVFQLPLSDLPLNHRPLPPSVSTLFLLSLSIFDFHQTESRLSHSGFLSFYFF